LSFSLLSTDCPAVQVFASSVYRNSAMDTTALVGPNIPGATTWRKQANQNVAVGDQTARYGAGLIGVPDGPTKIVLTVGTGLSLAVSKGHAMIGGPVEIPANTTVTVPDNTSRVWIWLLQTGAVLLPTTTTAPPAGECCLIGSCATNAGIVTSVDYSGVMYLRGGIGVRQTNDTGPPADTPPSTVVFIAATQGGYYFWNGAAYTGLAGSASSEGVSSSLFRQLLFILTELIGSEVLFTDDLQSEYELASAEV